MVNKCVIVCMCVSVQVSILVFKQLCSDFRVLSAM